MPIFAKSRIVKIRPIYTKNQGALLGIWGGSQVCWWHRGLFVRSRVGPEQQYERSKRQERSCSPAAYSAVYSSLVPGAKVGSVLGLQPQSLPIF